jgi:hypothetical protein
MTFLKYCEKSIKNIHGKLLKISLHHSDRNDAIQMYWRNLLLRGQALGCESKNINVRVCDYKMLYTSYTLYPFVW